MSAREGMPLAAPVASLAATGTSADAATPVVDPIDRALEAAEAHDHPSVLRALLDAWARSPSTELAALIARTSELVPSRASGLRGKTAAVLAAWRTLARNPEPADIAALLEGLCDASSSEGAKRLALVAVWPPDPRVDSALVALVERVPYRATSTQPFWRSLWPLLERISDSELIERLRAADRLIESNVAATMGAWLRAQLGKVVRKLVVAHAPPSTAPVAAPYARIGELLAAGTRRAAPRDDLDHLLRAIYEHPDDIGPRLVFADALMERGDPRGEFIALQCRGAEGMPLGRQQKQREKALLDAYGMSWLGPLAPIIMAGYRFERGFLAACRVDNEKRDQVRAVVGHPSWATVRELRGSAAIALHPIMRGLRSLRFDPMHALHAEGLSDAWRELLVTTERPLETLYYDGLVNQRAWVEEDPQTRRGFWRRTLDDNELDALLRCSALPKLRQLVIAEDPNLLVPRIFTAPVTRRLETLGIAFSPQAGFAAQIFAAGFLTAPVPTLQLEIRPDWDTTTLRLERGSAGYERVWMHLGPTSRRNWTIAIAGEALSMMAAQPRANWSDALATEAIAFLQVLPPNVRELRIECRKNFEPPALQRLRAAAAALPNLVVREIG